MDQKYEHRRKFYWDGLVWKRKIVVKSKTGMSNMDIVRAYAHGERPFITVGYITPTIKRKIGDQWEDTRGIMWEQKNGYKIRVNPQADLIKKIIKQKCRKCGMDIERGNKYDRLFFVKTGMCYECLTNYETSLRIVGIFDVYEQCKLLANEIGFFKDVKAKLKETVEFFNKEDTSVEVLCNSEGFREKFHGTNKDKILKDAKKDLTAVRRHLTEIILKMKKAREEFKQKATEFKIETYA